MATLREYRLRIGNSGLSGASLTNFRDPSVASGNTATVTSVRGGTNPYIVEPPNGEGSTFDALTGRVSVGQMTCVIADAITSGTDRVATAVLFDSSNRPQLLSRPAILEAREGGGAWATLISGFVTAIRLPDGIRVEVVVSDQSRASRRSFVFWPQPSERPVASDNAAARAAKLATWLARWPLRGCLFGGATGAFLSFVNPGGWWVNSYLNTGGETELKIGANYAMNAGVVTMFGPVLPHDGASVVNQYAARFFQRGPRGGVLDTGWLEGSDFPGLAAIYNGTPYPLCAGDAVAANYGWGPAFERKVVKNTYPSGQGLGSVVVKGTIATSLSARRLRIISIEPTFESPIYYTGHPADLLAKLWGELGEPYSAAAVTTAKEAIGTDLRVSVRMTEPVEYAAFVESTLLGPFGLSMRRNTSGEMEPFAARPLSSSSPSVTFTSAQVVDGGASVFDLAEESQVGRVVLSAVRLFPSGGADYSPTMPPDRAVLQQEQVERVLSAAGYGATDASYELAGMIHSASSIESDASGWTTTIAQDIALRQATGAPKAALRLIRGATGVNALALGDYVKVSLPQSPNQNKRYGDDNSVGARIMQVAKITEEHAVRAVSLIDTGPDFTFSGTTPTFAVAASSDAPKTIATVTISNASTLNGASPPIGVRVQVAVTTGGSPTTGQYTDAVAYAPGKVPTGAVYLAPVAPGSKVYVRVRGEQDGRRPQAYTAGSSVTLTALTNPSGVGTTSVEDRSFKVTLTPSGAGYPIEILLYEGSSDPTWGDEHTRARVAGGSTFALLTGLVASTNYRVAARERSPDGTTTIVSAGATTTTAAAASTSWSTAPTLSIRAGDAPSIQGGYLIDVTVGHVDASLEVQVDTSAGFGTAVGLGTFPAGTAVVRHATSSDSTTRYFRARHVSDTKGPSAWSGTVSGTPVEIGLES